jgi:hypothetical protein
VRSAAATKNHRAIHHQGQCQNAVKIGKVLEKHRGLETKEAESPEPAFEALIIAHLRGKAIYVSIDKTANSITDIQKDPPSRVRPIGRNREKARCLLYGETLGDRSKLTRHINSRHKFDKPFQYPACESQGTDALIPVGGPA